MWMCHRHPCKFLFLLFQLRLWEVVFLKINGLESLYTTWVHQIPPRMLESLEPIKFMSGPRVSITPSKSCTFGHGNDRFPDWGRHRSDEWSLTAYWCIRQFPQLGTLRFVLVIEHTQLDHAVLWFLNSWILCALCQMELTLGRGYLKENDVVFRRSYAHFTILIYRFLFAVRLLSTIHLCSYFTSLEMFSWHTPHIVFPDRLSVQGWWNER